MKKNTRQFKFFCRAVGTKSVWDSSIPSYTYISGPLGWDRINCAHVVTEKSADVRLAVKTSIRQAFAQEHRMCQLITSSSKLLSRLLLLLLLRLLFRQELDSEADSWQYALVCLLIPEVSFH
jgi:hypothetical protein